GDGPEVRDLGEGVRCERTENGRDARRSPDHECLPDCCWPPAQKLAARTCPPKLEQKRLRLASAQTVAAADADRRMPAVGGQFSSDSIAAPTGASAARIAILAAVAAALPAEVLAAGLGDTARGLSALLHGREAAIAIAAGVGTAAFRTK